MSSDVVPTNEDGFDLTNEANAFDVLFDESAQADYLQLEVAGEEFAFDLLGSTDAAAEASGSRVTYPDAVGETDLRYEVTSDGVKETLVLEDADASSSYRFFLERPAGSDLEVFEDEEGNWDFYVDDAHAPTFSVAAPVVVDAAGADGGSTNPASMEVTESEGGFYIDLSLDEGWLTAEERSFPVMLDPTIWLQEPEDETIDSSFPWDCPSCASDAGGRLLIGGGPTYAKWRAALRFDLEALPEDAQISDAELQVRFDGTCVKTNCLTTHNIEARRILDGWEPYSAPASFGVSSTVLDEYSLPDNASPQWMRWDLTSTTRDWFLGRSENHGIILKKRTESLDSSGPKPPSSKYPDESLRPKLEITWSNTATNLRPIEITHSTGAELEWTEASSSVSNFQSYVVHRSQSPGFTPSSTSKLVEISDRTTTSFVDSTAKPNTTFYYKVIVTGYGTSNERSVTTPASGSATANLRLSLDGGDATALQSNSSVGCEDGGAKKWLRVGTDSQQKYRALLRFDLSAIPTTSEIQSAQLSLYHRAEETPATRTVVVSQLKSGWIEGTADVDGECTDDGATWSQAQPGIDWSGADLTSADQVVVQDVTSRDLSGWDTFTGLGPLVQGWVNGEQPNHGLALSLLNETLTDGRSFVYLSDDYTFSSVLRPKLTLTYQDGSQPVAPQTSVGSPAADQTLVGSASNPVTLVASASDDGRVDKVEFLVDGTVVATSTAPTVDGAFQASWNPASVANGAHSVISKAYDDVGQTTTSNPVSFIVDNSQTSTSLTSPGNNPLQETVELTATASSGVGIDRVEFLVDGMVVGSDSSAPYAASWNTLDQGLPAYNGTHTLKSRAFATSGLSAESSPVTVTVDNSQSPATEIYDASIEFGSTSPPVPMSVLKNPDLEFDNLDPSYTPNSLAADPKDSTAAPADGGRAPIAGEGDPQTIPLTVAITNLSGTTWDNDRMRLWYRWINANDEVVYEAPADAFAEDIAPNATRTVELTVNPPSLPTGTETARYALRVDVYDTVGMNGSAMGGTWVSTQGVAPASASTQVIADDEDMLGLERYWHYDAEPVGAGMTHLANVASGNSLLRWTPMSSPGRGLATVVDLTYSSLNADGLPRPADPGNNGPAWSPVGANFSLSISSLTAFGRPLDLNPAPPSANPGNNYVRFVDGDGTAHKFIKSGARWQEPPGVNLYLRKPGTSDPDRTWAITRPDRVTFYFDAQGWPTSVEDRNGNTITFVDEPTGGSEDPGRPRRRITQVKDDAGRAYSLDYYTGTEAPDTCAAHPAVKGNVKTIADHEGHKIHFTYYKHGELRSIIQAGGTSTIGTPLPDRSFVFTYLSHDGSGPVTSNSGIACEINEQSSRIYSVQDPRGHKTFFDYVTPQGNKHKWKISKRTNREGAVTTYAYDDSVPRTTVDMPLGRKTVFTYDSTGKVVEITRSATSSRVETTKLVWSGDFAVTRLVEPSGKFQTFSYNPNGYMTTHLDQRLDDSDPATPPDPTKTKTTTLTYNYHTVDANDFGPSTEQSHISDLATVSSPEHSGSPWKFFYDAKFNIDYVLDPEGYKTDYLYDGADNGLLKEVVDAEANKTVLGPYDDNGLPTEVKVDFPEGQSDLVSRFKYSADGLMEWMQDPDHTASGSTGDQGNRTTFFYDRFHRLIRQTTPKSTQFEPGTLIVTSTSYDANDNVTKMGMPYYSTEQVGASVTSTYDDMDRLESSTGPESGVTSLMTYDAAGRLKTATSPNGSATSAVHDFVTEYDYDLLDRIVKTTRWDNPGGQERVLQSNYCYENDTGDLLWVTPPKGAGELTNGPCGATATTRPSTYSTGYVYYADHMLKSVTDPNGNLSSFTYDENGNTKTTKDPQGGVRTYSYDKRDLLVETIEPFSGSRKLTTRYEYDGVGNLTKLITPRAYDAREAGTVTKYFTAYEYDAANRLIRTTLPKASSGAEDVFVHHVYQGSRLTTMTLPTTHSDATLVPADGKRAMTYFDPGWIRTSYDGVNPRTAFDYEASGWQSSRRVVYPATQLDARKVRKMIWDYYPDGMLKERRDQRDDPVKYFYDKNNNLIEARDSSGLKAKDDEKPVKLLAEYDWLDRPVKVKHRKGLSGSGPYTYTSYSYDPNGNLDERVDDAVEGSSDGRTHDFTYDVADRFTSGRDYGKEGCSDDYLITNEFFPNAWEKSRSIARGCGEGQLVGKTEWEYFENGKMKKLTTSGGGQVLEAHELSYLDNSGFYVNGHRTEDKFGLSVPDKQSQCEPTTSNSTPCTARFTYDARERLIEHHDGHGGQTTYAFDQTDKLSSSSVRAGNLTTETTTSNGNTSTTNRYYEGMQLVKAQTTESSASHYLYDPFGNLDCMVSSATAGRSACRQKPSGYDSRLLANYSYDGLDRLKEYAFFNGSGSKTKRSTFAYDALDRIVKQTGRSTVGGTTTTTAFAYLGLSSLVSSENGTESDKTYSYDAYGRRVSLADDVGDSTNHYTYGYDVHGSVSLLVNAGGTSSGQPKASYGYQPYGAKDDELTGGDPSTSNPINPYRFSNKRMEPISQSLDMGARRFGPDIRSFLQRDAYGSAVADLGLSADALTQNRYSLAGGNPISFVEADGHGNIDENGNTRSPFYFNQTPGDDDPGIGGFVDLSGSNDDSGDSSRLEASSECPSCHLGNPYLSPDRPSTVDEGELTHLMLDTAGLAPLLGEPADLLNAILYAGEGNSVDAALSAGAMIPIGGWGASAAKGARRASKFGDEAAAATDEVVGGGSHAIKTMRVSGFSEEDIAAIVSFERKLSMDEATEIASNFVNGRGVMEVASSGNYQFKLTEALGIGRTSRMGRFDVAPHTPDRNFKEMGPHLNLETHVNGEPVENIHSLIDPNTIRPGDYPPFP